MIDQTPLHTTIQAEPAPIALGADGSFILPADWTERLNRVHNALVAAVSPQEVAQAILDESLKSLNAVAGGVCLVEANGVEQRLVAVVAPGICAEQLESWSTFSLDAPFPINETVNTRTFVEVESFDEYTRRWPELARVLADCGYQAYLAAPLELGERAIGAINFNFDHVRTFCPEERGFVIAVARLAAQAIQRARRYEREQEARAEAELASRAKGDFLAVMSHELRTPLNTISGYIDLMLEGVHGPLPDSYRRYAERMRAAQKHVNGLIDSVLRFAKLEAGQVTYSITTHSVNELFKRLEPLIEPQISAREIALVIQPVDRALHVRADAEKTVQILLNLVTNAIKYTDANGLITTAARREGDSVTISVTDTGRGIPNDRLERIFEPFVRINPDRHTDGVGLGLAISRQMARAMGGDLEVTSTVGRGSSFSLRLPAAP
jgi:signal transduction histidine kinase